MKILNKMWKRGGILLPVKSKEDFFNAYNVLFGPGNEISIESLRHLQPSALN